VVGQRHCHLSSVIAKTMSKNIKSSVDADIVIQESRDENIPKASVIRIPPFSYIHVLDTNLNVTRLETGPKSLTCLDHEQVVYGPQKMIVVPPNYYCIIQNPVVFENDARDTNNNSTRRVIKDKHGQAKLRHGEQEIRLHTSQPFPLYPGEILVGGPQGIQALKVVEDNTALRLRAIRNFTERDADNKPIQREAGDEWLFIGPGTYYPRVEVEVVETIAAYILQKNQALHIKARRECKDQVTGKQRNAGEEWLVIKEGAYLPGVEEIVVRTVTAYTLLRNKTALHLRALKTFTDKYEKIRKAGDEWLVTFDDAESHIPDVNEQVVDVVTSITLYNNQYCTILDPVDETGKPQFGQRKRVIGPTHFFLQPGERLEGGPQQSWVLAPWDALVVKASQQFNEVVTDGVTRREVARSPGDKWYVYGPQEYIPAVESQVLERRSAIIQIEPLGLYYFYSMPSFVLFVVLVIFFLFYMAFF